MVKHIHKEKEVLLLTFVKATNSETHSCFYGKGDMEDRRGKENTETRGRHSTKEGKYRRLIDTEDREEVKNREEEGGRSTEIRNEKGTEKKKISKGRPALDTRPRP